MGTAYFPGLSKMASTSELVEPEHSAESDSATIALFEVAEDSARFSGGADSLEDCLLDSDSAFADQVLRSFRKLPENWRQVDPDSRILMASLPLQQRISLCDILIGQGYQHLSVLRNSEDLQRLMRTERPNLVILDADEDQQACLEQVRTLSSDPALSVVPVLVLCSDDSFRRPVLQAGASDFISKPVVAEDLLPSVRNAVLIHRCQRDDGWLQGQFLDLVTKRTEQLEISRNQLIRCLARAAEFRDNETGNHVVRVGRFTSIIARQMGYPESRLGMLEQAAQMHDVGKIGIPDSILFKPGRLAAEEYELIKKHCSLGRQIIEPLSRPDNDLIRNHTTFGRHLMDNGASSLLMLAASIAQNHHEHWDGSGYPHGLSGEEIPLEGRIVAVADVYDALSSRRPYKEPFPRHKCLEVIAEGRGTQFDPEVVDAFFVCAERIREVQIQLMDLEESSLSERLLQPDDPATPSIRSGHTESRGA